VNAQLESPSSLRERRVFHRKLLVWIHAIVGCATMLVYLNQINLAGLAWAPGAGVAEILIATPAIIPYVISAAYSWQVVTYHRGRVALFILLLITGSLLMGSVIVGAFGSLGRVALLWAFGVQAYVYFWAAELLLNVV
jgi:hypothetical protein